MLWMLMACQTTPPPTSATPPPSPFTGVAQTFRDEYRLAVSAAAPPGVWMLCRMPLVGTDIPYHSGADHTDVSADTQITVYVNETAWPAMQQTGPRTFPAGSVIVKEKTDGDLGMMAKTADGWQYAYVPRSGEIVEDQTKLSHCSSCHQHGTVPESVKAHPGTIHLTDPRDEVFLSATP